MKLTDEVIFQFLLTSAKIVSELLNLHMGYLTYFMTCSISIFFQRGLFLRKKLKKAALGIIRTKLRKWFFWHMLTYVGRNNKASLVNMLVILCGKLECSFLKATMLLLYLHFSTTAKVPHPETWQITKVINRFFDKRMRKATKSLWRFGLVRF